MPDPVYLDYNATTPMDPRVLEAMIPWFLTPSNAGSRTHVYGQRAKDAVENARKQVAELLCVKTEEIFFTSGATESNNIAILGLQRYAEATGRKHIISTTIEHKAVLEPLQRMKSLGFDVQLAPVTRGGHVEPEMIQKMLRPDTLLVSVMHANNETGILQPVNEIAEIIASSTPKSMGSIPTLFHIDAAQTFGKEVDAVKSLRCDLLSISGHKIYGPQGIGALYVRNHGAKKRVLEPITFGGGQERGLRPGTLPVALAVGFGESSRLAALEWKDRRNRATKTKADLLQILQSVEHKVNGDPNRCLSHVLNITLCGIESEAIMMAAADDVAMSNGSACTSTKYQLSHVLLAMGLPDDEIDSAVRLSWADPFPTSCIESVVKKALSLKG